MHTGSVWQADAPETAYPALEGERRCDVLVIGAGITGTTLAEQLASAGKSVVVLEAAQVGSGTTGHSTGNLYETLSDGLHSLASRWGDDVMRTVVQARRDTVDHIGELTRRLQLDNGFKRCTHYRFAVSSSGRARIDQEARALARAGSQFRLNDALPAAFVAAFKGPFAPLPRLVLALEGQAQLHPLRHVQGLARAASQSGCQIFEQSPVLGMDYTRRSASTANGRVLADAMVLATHSPKGFHPVQAEMVVHQEYMLALAVEKGTLAPGVFWASGDDALSLRALQSAGGSDYLLCAGQEHTTGDHDTAWAEARLASTVQKYFGRTDAAFRWVAQNYRSADGLPFVGEDLTGCYVATGFATDGLVWGTLAARVLADELLGRKHPLDHLLDARRFSPVKGARILLEENLTVTKALVKDYLLPERASSLSGLAPGEGALVRLGKEDVAAYHHPDGAFSLVSPVCPHMKCKVRWSSASASWDCPCHGSRFRPDGSVIEGPALQPLAPRGHLLDQALADEQSKSQTHAAHG